MGDLMNECPAVLFLIFNRPDLVEQSFSRIREAKPAQLFVAADGPRANREGEAGLCNQARTIVEKVDWDCEVKTLFRDDNLGCRRAVSSAITWFFEHVEEGIILEDDCVADLSFFRFSAELLERYRDDERIMCVTGNNFQDGIPRGDASYYFSIYNHCWGWASWRRAWSLYDAELSALLELTDQQFLEGFQRPLVAKYWSNCFHAVLKNEVDSWAYVWTFSCWANSGLTAIPNVNLVKNIGFDERATHTTGGVSPLANMATHSVISPLEHPANVLRHQLADQWTEDTTFEIRAPSPPPTLAQRIRRRVKRFLFTSETRTSR